MITALSRTTASVDDQRTIVQYLNLYSTGLFCINICEQERLVEKFACRKCKMVRVIQLRINRVFCLNLTLGCCEFYSWSS